MTRAEVEAVLGKPTDWDAIHRPPMIYKYCDTNIEYHFGRKRTDGLWMIYFEDEDLEPIVLLK